MDQDPSQAQVIAVDFQGMLASRANLTHIMMPLCIIVALFTTGSCGDSSANKDGKDSDPDHLNSPQRLVIVCTTPVLAQIAARLIGEHAHVHCIMQADEPADQISLHAADMVALKDATLIFTHGQTIEGRLIETFKASVPANQMIEVSDGLALDVDLSETLREPAHWVHPRIHQAMVTRMRDVLVTVAASNSDGIHKNAQFLIEENKGLSDWITARTTDHRSPRHTVITNSSLTAQLMTMLGHPVMRVELNVDFPTQADESRLLSASKATTPALLAIDDHSNEAANDMIRRVARATGATVMHPTRGEWPALETAHIDFIKEHVNALLDQLVLTAK